MSKKVLVAVICLFAMSTVAQAAIPADWVNHINPIMGTWNVKGESCTDNITWTIRNDKSYVSDSGMSEIAYGYKNPGSVEFILYYTSFAGGTKYYYYEKAHDQVNSYNDIPGQTQMDQYTEITFSGGGAVATDNFTDNFTCFTRSAIGPYPVLWGARGDNETEADCDPCIDNVSTCNFTRIIPAKIGRIAALVQPIMPFVLIAEKDQTLNKDKATFDSDAIRPLFQIKIGRTIIVFTFLRFGQLESGSTIMVDAGGCSGSIEIR